ncbi:MAG: hydroxyethylthiazole kinase [Lachnospira sp.]
MIKEIADRSPLVHCITSPVAINDCANVVLAMGAKPFMAEHPKEVADITAGAQALTVSLANVTDARMASIMISGSEAHDKNIPHIIDLVGVTCSKLRMNLAKEYIKKYKPSVIKGNVSEIKAVAGVDFSSIGVDAGKADAVSDNDESAKSFMAELTRNYAKITGAIVEATGAVDIISDSDRTVFVKNGSSNMPYITGTGCMLTCITGAYMSVLPPFEAAVNAAAMFGICGERADGVIKRDDIMSGLGSYHVKLLDEVSKITSLDVDKYKNIEICSL